MTEETPKKEEQEQFSKDEVDTMISEKLSEQEESFDAKIAAIKEELTPEVKAPQPGEATKYVDDTFGSAANFSYNDLMTKVVEVVKEHVPSADVESVSKQVLDSLKTEESKVKEESKQADEAWDNQITELKKAEKLDDKTVTEIITKATKWNKTNPDGLITSMKLAHEYWKKDEKKAAKPRIPGSPTNNVDEDDEQKIFESTEAAQAYWLETHGE